MKSARKVFIAVCLGLTSLTAQADSALWTTLESTPQYSRFVKGLELTGLDDKLKGADTAHPVTVFAPTNEAFARLDVPDKSKLFSSSNRDRLRDVLNLHLVAGNIAPKEAKQRHALGSNQGQSLIIEAESGALRVSGVEAQAVQAFTSGRIYRLDQVLIPRQ
ncbi:fasciclin domain-containing protein [Larsenimonas suaedae]|uniref:Fasciclin domain-containing protein n=1 Tax=Larsenimonas suaedae TaxID=1851019 RepID=A0ABU1GY23_9GAMM|nr:fasciclin domain-containing protein [Larsenimonas suaedae]MCM2973029.1 fasciclin domain-containing protein [Larsenimonas suaedae]MDR5896466.1 fasciclin domain-containing protein [Larsenimonas suaedae]